MHQFNENTGILQLSGSPYEQSGHITAEIKCGTSAGDPQKILGPSNEPYLLMAAEPYSGDGCSQTIAELRIEWYCTKKNSETGGDSESVVAPESGDECCFDERGLAGLYEVDYELYNQSARNELHDVSITYNCSSKEYTWTNKAGTSWSLLNLNPAKKTLDVSQDSHYYSYGYTKAFISCDKGQYITGPLDEPYLLQASLTDPQGCQVKPPLRFCEQQGEGSGSGMSQTVIIAISASVGGLTLALLGGCCLAKHFGRSFCATTRPVSISQTSPQATSFTTRTPEIPIALPSDEEACRHPRGPPFNPDASSSQEPYRASSFVSDAPPPYSAVDPNPVRW